MARLGGFSLLPLAGLLSTLVALPSVTSAYGASGWAAIAIGQSVGMTAAVFVELGWGLNGPQRIAPMSDSNARRTYALSLWTRGTAAVPSAIVSAVLAFVMSPSYPLVSAWTAVGATLGGMSALWFYIGRGTPWVALLAEALPRLALMSVVAVLLSIGYPLVTFPIVGLVMPAVFSPFTGALIVGTRWADLTAFSPSRVMRAFRAQGAALSGRTLSSLYIGATVGLVGIASPGSVPSFAAADRIMRLGLTALAALPNAMQRWVGSQNSRETRFEAARRAILVNTALGAAAGVAYLALAQVASTILFSGTVQLDTSLTLAGALVVALTCTSRATGGIALVAMGQVRAIAASALWGAVVGVPSILILSFQFGATGGMVGAAIAEIVVLIVQVAALTLTYQRKGRRPA